MIDVNLGHICEHVRRGEEQLIRCRTRRGGVAKAKTFGNDTATSVRIVLLQNTWMDV